MSRLLVFRTTFKQIDLEAKVLQIINSMGIESSSYDIAACHRLNNKKDNQESKNTIVRFVCRKKVFEIMSKKKKLGEDELVNKLGKEYFIVENLSPMNKKTLDACSYLKKKKLVKSCWSFNGTINIKFTDRENEKPTRIFHYDDIFYYIPKAENFLDL